MRRWRRPGGRGPAAGTRRDSARCGAARCGRPGANTCGAAFSPEGRGPARSGGLPAEAGPSVRGGASLGGRGWLCMWGRGLPAEARPSVRGRGRDEGWSRVRGGGALSAGRGLAYGAGPPCGGVAGWVCGGGACRRRPDQACEGVALRAGAWPGVRGGAFARGGGAERAGAGPLARGRGLRAEAGRPGPRFPESLPFAAAPRSDHDLAPRGPCGNAARPERERLCGPAGRGGLEVGDAAGRRAGRAQRGAAPPASPPPPHPHRTPSPIQLGPERARRARCPSG